MSSSKKTLVFFISFFAAIIFMSLLSYIFRPFILISSEPVVNNILYPIYVTLAFIFFLLFQSFFRFYINKKTLKKHAPLLTVKASKFNLQEKLWFYIIIAAIYFLGLIKNFSLDPYTLVRVLLFLISLGLVEFIIRASQESMNIYFLRQGILVTGMDTRIKLPISLGTDVQNDSGFYSYNDIDSYFIYPDHIELFIILENGKLSFETGKELTKKVVGLLKMQKIEIKKNF